MDGLQEKIGDRSRVAREKGFKVPYVHDLVSGNFRSRENSVLVFSFMIASCILTLCFFAFDTTKQPGFDIAFETAPIQVATYGVPIANFSVRVRRKENKAPVVAVEVSVFAVSTQLMPLYMAGDPPVMVRDVDCAELYAEQPGLTADADEELCRVTVEGTNRSTTDADGIALFPDLVLTSGPPGSVMIVITVTGEKTYGTHVLKMKSPLLDSPADVTVLMDQTEYSQWSQKVSQKTCNADSPDACWASLPIYGGTNGSQRLSIPVRARWLMKFSDDVYLPALRKFDENHNRWDLGPGLMSSDMYAVMTCLPLSQAHAAAQESGGLAAENEFVADPTDDKVMYFHDAVQRASVRILLENDTFLGSPCYGCAVYEATWDVAVSAWDSHTQHIGFHLSGQNGMLELPEPPLALTPRKVTYEVPIYSAIGNIEVLTKPTDAAIMEEVALSPTAQFKIVDHSGNPMAGKRMFARITVRAGIRRPPAEARSKGQGPRNRWLIRPVSTVSGADGVVSFPGLAFAVGGPLGLYEISFGAEGHTAGCPDGSLGAWASTRCPVWVGQVKTRVATARAFWDSPPTEVTLGELWATTPSVLVSDSTGSAVRGKTLELVFTPASGNISFDFEVNPSGGDGWVTLQFVNITAYSEARTKSQVGLKVELIIDDAVRETYQLTLLVGTLPTYIPPAPPAPYPCRTEEECGPLHYYNCRQTAMKIDDASDRDDQLCWCEAYRSMCEMRTALAPDVGWPVFAGSDNPYAQPGCAPSSILSECQQRVRALNCGADDYGKSDYYCEAASEFGTSDNPFFNCDPLQFQKCVSNTDSCISTALTDATTKGTGGNDTLKLIFEGFCTCLGDMIECGGNDSASCLGHLGYMKLCTNAKDADDQLKTLGSSCYIEQCDGYTQSRRAAVLEKGTAGLPLPHMPAVSKVQKIMRDGLPDTREAAALEATPAPETYQSKVGCAFILLEEAPAEVTVGTRFGDPFFVRALSAYGDPLMGVPVFMEVVPDSMNGIRQLVNLDDDVTCETLLHPSRCKAFSRCKWMVVPDGTPDGKMRFCVTSTAPPTTGSVYRIGPVVTDEWGVAIFRRYRVSAALASTTITVRFRAYEKNNWGRYTCTSPSNEVIITARIGGLLLDKEASDIVATVSAGDEINASLSNVRAWPEMLQAQTEVRMYHTSDFYPFVLRPLISDQAGKGYCFKDNVCVANVFDVHGKATTPYPGLFVLGGSADGLYGQGVYPRGMGVGYGAGVDAVASLVVDESADPSCNNVAPNSFSCASAGCLWNERLKDCYVPQGRPFPTAPRVYVRSATGDPVSGVSVYVDLELLPEAVVNANAGVGLKKRNVSSIELIRGVIGDDVSHPYRKVVNQLSTLSGTGSGIILNPEDDSGAEAVAALRRIVAPSRQKGYYTSPVVGDYKVERGVRFKASNPSDALGVAEFKDLGVVGAVPGVYRMVYRFLRAGSNIAAVSATSQYLIYIPKPGLKATISEKSSALASPGVPLSVAPQVQVTDPLQEGFSFSLVMPFVQVFKTDGSSVSGQAAISPDFPRESATAVAGKLKLTGFKFTARSQPGTYRYRLLVPGASTPLSDPVQVTESAGAVELKQAPKTVQVGASFLVKVFVGIANRAPLPGVSVTARLERIGDTACLADGCGKLDPGSVTGITDETGIASLQVRLLSASPAEYKLKLTSSAGVSNTMRTARGAASVVLAATQTLPSALRASVVSLTADSSSLASLGMKLRESPDAVVAQGVAMLQGVQKAFSSEVASRAMLEDMSKKLTNMLTASLQEANQQSVVAQINVVNTVKNVSILVQPALDGSPSLSSSGPVRRLSRSPKLRVTGSGGRPLVGKSVQVVALPLKQKAELQWNAMLTTDDAGEVTLDPLEFSRGGSGTYRLVFLVDGVASVESGELKFSKPKSVSATERLKDRLLIMLAFMLPLFRANYTKSHPAWSILGLIALGGYAIYFSQEYKKDLNATVFEADSVNGYIIVFLVATSTLGFLLIVSTFWVFYIAAKGKVRQGMFSMKRAESAIAYTKWLVGLRVPAETRQIVYPPQSIIDKIKRKPPPPDPHAPPKDINPIFFPMRFIIAMLAVIVMITIAICFIWYKRDGAVEYTDKMGNSVPEPPEVTPAEKVKFNARIVDTFTTTISILSSLSPKLFKPLQGFLPKVKETDWYNLWDKAYEWTSQAAAAVKDAATAATVIAIFMQIVNIAMLVLATRRNIMLVRRGKQMEQEFLRSKVSMYASEQFIGLQVMHFTLGFIMAWCLVYLVFLVLLFPPLRSLLFNKIWGILLGMIGITLAQMLFEMFVVNKFFSNQLTLFHPRLFGLWALPALFINFVAGAMKTVARCGMAIGMVCLWFPRMDLCLFPELKFMDKGWMGYWSMIFCDEVTNNPTAKVFISLLIVEQRKRQPPRESKAHAGEPDLPTQIGLIVELLKQGPLIKVGKAGEEQGTQVEWKGGYDLGQVKKEPDLLGKPEKPPPSAKVRQRWWMAYVLTANPSLRAYRKFRIGVPEAMAVDEGEEKTAPTAKEDWPAKHFDQSPAGSPTQPAQASGQPLLQAQYNPNPQVTLGGAQATPRQHSPGSQTTPPTHSYQGPLSTSSTMQSGSPSTSNANMSGVAIAISGRLPSQGPPGADSRPQFKHFVAVSERPAHVSPPSRGSQQPRHLGNSANLGNPGPQPQQPSAAAHAQRVDRHQRQSPHRDRPPSQPNSPGGTFKW